MTHDLARVSARLFNAPLLLAPDAAVTIASNLAARLGVAPMRPPGRISAWDDDGSGGGATRGESKPYEIVDGVAVIPVRGELVNRGSWLDAYSGLVSYESLCSALRSAEEDAAVTGIVLDMDSPGGEAAGAMEAAGVVRAVSKTKRVTAFVNSLAASAAYAIAAGASEIVMTPSSMVGSIGVIWLHMDYSKSLAEAGVKPTILTEGDFKKDGNQLEPLEPAAKARIQATIRSFYDLFVESVGQHRPKLGVEGARKTEAGVYVGAAAVEAGLANRLGSMDGVLGKMGASRVSRGAYAERQARKILAQGAKQMAVKLYKPGESHADGLIVGGKVDKTSSWSFSAEDGDNLLGDSGDDWTSYAQFHLGEDTEETAETKARFKYPHGKDGKVFRSALVAIRSRASQQGATDIFDAAGRLLEKIDKDNAKESALNQAQIDAAIATGHAAGHAIGHADGVAAGRTEGAASERARIEAIVTCDEAKGREDSAKHLAFKTSMSLDDAKGVLAGVAAAPPASAGRMGNVPRPPIQPGADSRGNADPQAATDAMWGDVVKKIAGK